MMNEEIVLYMQQIRNYVNNNPEAKAYFNNESDKDLFCDLVEEIAIGNYELTFKPDLNVKQFEYVRHRIYSSILTRTNSKNKPFIDRIFIDKRENYTIIL